MADTTDTQKQVFVASIATETNTFSPLRTDLQDFKDSFYAAPGQHPDTPTLCSAVYPVARRVAKQYQWAITEGTASWAEPGGIVNQQTWEFLRDQLLAELQDAMPVDIVLLGLHGAMVAQECDDCEGELIELVRQVVGKQALIGVTFDPHSHLSERRTTHADIITIFKEFPHTDFVETAENLIELGHNEVLSVSVVHGFMAGDVPDLGTKVLVVTNQSEGNGVALARSLGLELFSFRGQTRPTFLPAAEAVSQALGAKGHPTVLADVWDNPGGGAAGDSTIILRELFAQQSSNTALATIWDPIAGQDVKQGW